MHNMGDMLDLLENLALHYPQAKYTDAQLAILAGDWCEDLAGFPFDVLCQAVRHVRREEGFFPNVKTLRDYAGAVMAQRRAAQKALPPPDMTPEKMERGARMAQLIVKKLQGDKAASREIDALLGLLETGRHAAM